MAPSLAEKDITNKINSITNKINSITINVQDITPIASSSAAIRDYMICFEGWNKEKPKKILSYFCFLLFTKITGTPWQIIDGIWKGTTTANTNTIYNITFPSHIHNEIGTIIVCISIETRRKKTVHLLVTIFTSPIVRHAGPLMLKDPSNVSANNKERERKRE